MSVENPTVGIIDFLENHLDYRIKLIVPILLVVGVVYMFIHMRDLERRADAAQKAASTLEQKFQKVGDGAVANNAIANQKDLNQQGKDAVNPAVLLYMQQQGAVLASLTTSLATVSSRISGLETRMPTDFGGKQDSTTGTLTGFPLEENRKGADGRTLPPTAMLNLSYNPTLKDPNLAFKGSLWQHYQEAFKVTQGAWEKKDGGFKTSIGLTRTISKPDPTDPTKMIVVGQEDIPIGDANTVFGPKGMVADPFKMPRWTLMLGVSRDANFGTGSTSGINGYQPAATIDFRVSNKYGVTFGAVNKSAVVGLSVRLGSNK